MSAHTAETDAGLEDLIFATLIAHQRIPTYATPGENRCIGCDNLAGATDGSNSPRHTRHLAALVATVVRAAARPPSRTGEYDIPVEAYLPTRVTPPEVTAR